MHDTNINVPGHPPPTASAGLPLLALVVPCYNEEAVLPRTLEALSALLARLKAEGRVAENSFALYVDDGSRDTTWEIIARAHHENPHCRGLKFAGNAGHQNAVLAGMYTARDWGVDCIISLDADLQDDITAIGPMLDRYGEGCQIVYGVRNDRSTDTSFKRNTATCFYKCMELLKVKLVPNHADFRLVARPALEALESFGEHQPFLRGIFPAMGFKTARVEYKRLRRQAGESKYPLLKMLSFAWKGITSFSAAPLRIAGLLSALSMLVALALSVVVFFDYLDGSVVSGWTSLIIVVLFMGSVQLFCLSVMGEYLAKVFEEAKKRPRYIVESTLS